MDITPLNDYIEKMEHLITRVRESVAAHRLIETGERVLLSLSAGKDSMFLFRAMSDLADESGFEVAIFHLNHMIRGAESDREEEHVASLARENGIELFAERHDFRKDRPPGVSFEEHARTVRYRILEEIASSRGYHKVATAHTRDDQIETILMRIFTGTGIYGLRGMLPRRNNIIRPLLGITSEEIYAYLRARSISWIEDSSNADISYSRNYIRHRVLPLVRQKFRMADESLASLGEVAGDTMALVDTMMQSVYPGVIESSSADILIDAGRLASRPPAFNHAVSTVIRDQFGHQVNRSMLDLIRTGFMIDKANVRLYADAEIRADKVFRGGKSVLRISSSSSIANAAVDWEYPLPLPVGAGSAMEIPEVGLSLTIKITDYEEFEKFRENPDYVFVSMENGIKSLYIRNRREGDRIRTEQGTKKIKDLLIEKKLDGNSKDRVPILTADSTVIACMPGLLYDIPNRVAVDFLVDKKSRKVLAVIKN